MRLFSGTSQGQPAHHTQYKSLKQKQIKNIASQKSINRFREQGEYLKQVKSIESNSMLYDRPLSSSNNITNDILQGKRFKSSFIASSRNDEGGQNDKGFVKLNAPSMVQNVHNMEYGGNFFDKDLLTSDTQKSPNLI